MSVSFLIHDCPYQQKCLGHFKSQRHKYFVKIGDTEDVDDYICIQTRSFDCMPVVFPTERVSHISQGSKRGKATSETT